MMKSVYAVLIALFILTAYSDPCAQMDGRYLVLNFDCHGEAYGKSEAIGDSLRHYMMRSGASVVSRDLTSQLIARKNLSESDLNFVIEDLRRLMVDLNADAAVYGHVISSHDILTVELRLIEKNQDKPLLFDPIVCGKLVDIYQTMPRMAELILSPDKSKPIVLSVQPSEGDKNIQQFVELKVTFSKPMNPATHSITGFPENMWKRYGKVSYIDSTNTFVFKLHLYPDIQYEFHVNGAESKGFKDGRGNVASEYVWRFTTGHW